ncbi:MAG: hypothetical protein HFG80_01650 [Eubacterium sp.]|nr:hypothetical protein [Eubacterium sp.]
MFYDMKLDDRSYREIEEEAVFHIPGECPQWTNYNPSDPGMTLVQLFSWLTEVQQYHLSQPDERKRKKYLELFGIRLRHIRPSAGAVTIEPGLEQFGKQIPLQKGTRFFADDLAFETVKKEWVHPARLIGACMVRGNSYSNYYNIGNESEKQMQLYPFGEEAETGNQCCFILDRPLSNIRENNIYFDIRTEYGITRNPADEGFLPLAKLEWEYYGSGGWEPLQVEADHTHAFLQSGKICFRIPKEMAKDRLLGAYVIRVTLAENDFDVAPLIRNIYLNEIEVKQQYTACDYEEYELDVSGTEDSFSVCTGLSLADTGKAELYIKKEASAGGSCAPENRSAGQNSVWYLCKEIRREKTTEGDTRLWFPKPAWAKGTLSCRLAVFEKDMEEKRLAGKGNAFANQEFELHVSDLVYEEFEILVYDEENGGYVGYEKTEDFDGCTPEDAVYLLEPKSGKLLFGDCERGMAPEGEIRIIRMKFSAGSAGNIKADKIRDCESCPGLLVRQYKSTKGGRDDETVSECFERFRRKMREVHRGVTGSDYETLVKKAPGLLIQDSRVIPPAEWEDMGVTPPENMISIVVQPFGAPGQHKVLSETYRRNLKRILDKKKMIGTRIRLLNPEYIAVSVYAEIVVRPQFPDAKKRMEETVRNYLNERTWEIGKPVLCSVLYGLLDTLPCVQQVKSLSVNAGGNGCRYRMNGDIALPPNGLAYGKDLEFCIFTGNEG